MIVSLSLLYPIFQLHLKSEVTRCSCACICTINELQISTIENILLFSSMLNFTQQYLHSSFFHSTALLNSSFAMQFSPRVDSTLRDFPTGTSCLAKGRLFLHLPLQWLIEFTASVSWGASNVLEKTLTCLVPCTPEEITGYLVISFLIRFWLLVQDVPKGKILLSNHYGDSFTHLLTGEALSALPGRQESCTVPGACSWLALRCSSRVQSSLCMLDHRHENSLYMSEHQHLQKTWWLWCCIVYPGILFLRFTAFKMHYICCCDGVKNKKRHRKEQLLNANPLVTSSLLSLLSHHLSKKQTQSSQDHKSNCSAEKLLVVLAQLTVLPTGASKLNEKRMQKMFSISS